MPHAESVLRLTLVLKNTWHGSSVHELLEGSSASKVKPTHPDSPAQCCSAAARVRLAEPSSSPATSAPASASSGLEGQGSGPRTGHSVGSVTYSTSSSLRRWRARQGVAAPARRTRQPPRPRGRSPGRRAAGTAHRRTAPPRSRRACPRAAEPRRTASRSALSRFDSRGRESSATRCRGCRGRCAAPWCSAARSR